MRKENSQTRIDVFLRDKGTFLDPKTVDISVEKGWIGCRLPIPVPDILSDSLSWQSIGLWEIDTDPKSQEEQGIF